MPGRHGGPRADAGASSHSIKVLRGLGPEHETAPRRRLFHSPSRSRFRPPRPLTFGFRLRPSRGASTSSRPVLDARGTVRPVQGGRKRVEDGPAAFCEFFFYQHFHSDSSSLWRTERRLSTLSPGGWGRLSF